MINCLNGCLSLQDNNFMELIKMLNEKQKQQFDEHLLLKEGLQEVTREGYIRSINIVLRRIGKTKPNHKQYKKYMLWLHKQQYSYSHITNTGLAIWHYTNYLRNPLRIARTKKPKRLLKEYLTEAEINTLIRATKNIREKAIISLLSYSGIRNKEFCNLKVKDIDLCSNQIRVISGKGIKDRIANIGVECSKILIEYLNKYPREQEDYLFTTLRNNNQYATGDLRKIINTLKQRVGFSKRIYPHLFRHSLATNLLKRGANLMTIKEQLGHNFIDSTMIYVQSFPQTIKSEYDYYIPAYI